MPIGDAYLDDSLMGVVGAWPATGAVYAFWSADPTLADDPTSVEVDLSVAGLTNPDFDPAGWSAADGAAATTAALSLGTSTGALDDVGAYWGIKDSTGALVYSDDIADADQIVVTDSGTTVSFTPSLTFGAA